LLASCCAWPFTANPSRLATVVLATTVLATTVLATTVLATTVNILATAVDILVTSVVINAWRVCSTQPIECMDSYKLGQVLDWPEQTL